MMVVLPDPGRPTIVVISFGFASNEIFLRISRPLILKETLSNKTFNTLNTNTVSGKI